MDWPVYALIAYAVLGVAGMIWVDMRFQPPPWLSWPLWAAVVLPFIWFVLKRSGLTDVEALWALPFMAVIVAVRLGIDWLVEKFRTRNDD